jgi:hypothetical protein
MSLRLGIALTIPNNNIDFLNQIRQKFPEQFGIFCLVDGQLFYLCFYPILLNLDQVHTRGQH